MEDKLVKANNQANEEEDTKNEVNNGPINGGHLNNKEYSEEKVTDTILQRYENFFKYCCICVVRKRKSIGTSSRHLSATMVDGDDARDGGELAVDNPIYRIEYDPNVTSILPVISYHMVKAINGHQNGGVDT